MKRHPIVQAWVEGKTDAGGCIADLERENVRLRRFVQDWLDDWTAPGPTDSPREAEARELLSERPA